MRKPRRENAIDEKISYFCKRNNLKLNTKQKNDLINCYLLYALKFSSKSKFYEYIKTFIKYDVKFWKSRLQRLSQINLKAVTKTKFFLMYGKTEALIRWNNYKKMQSLSNTYEYKKEKYGWSEEKFIEYNLSRSVTLNNMIKKYGEELGENKYKNYVEKQKKSGCTLDYFIEKYGEIDGTIKYNETCQSKSLTLPNFIKKYGENLGRKKYRDYCEIRPTFYSKLSQELFWKIKTNDCYFAEYNKEFGSHSNTGYYFYDFVDTKLKKCIEFNGDYWHLNPNLYREDHQTHYGYTAEQIWEKDKMKIDHIKSLGYDVMIIWESEYLNKPNKVIEKIGEFLNGKD